MYKKTITYEDFNGVQRTEDFYFNLTEAEITNMQLTTVGGLAEMVERVIAAKDKPTLVNIFQRIIRQSYGVKSPDGRKFMKSDEIWMDFAQTNAYSIFYMELATNAKVASDFINGITPSSISAAREQDAKIIDMPVIQNV